ncbi:hypothetical protein, variant 1 [Aphanomyces astaci]|uniref:Uncharacterized protein n=1 Tax=Aphanomyces astaci TaxID=112090 RepID=W4GSH1_APHAT|nr:hypothetical protein, variant 1 [Aphanomyces astaci]ETV82281.1 hypothetical protein, variant 1 [Aphanomyces astaci]|eukprot:XP_009827950.1 hypothetical protein, variant 1 [Aphanomyces astaci]
MIRSQQRHAVEDDEVDVPLHMLEDLGIEFEFEMDTESMSRAYFECAAEGNVETLRFLLSSDVHGELLNSVDVDGFSALMIAAAEGNRDVVLELLRRNADANLRTFELKSAALHFAAKNGDPEIVEEMCKHTTQIDFWNINADTPLVWACIEGRDAAVAVLLRHGADPRVTNHYGATTLMCATMIGEDTDDATDMARKVIVTLLLTMCPDLVNVQDRDGSTAMHLAASCGYLQCCRALLEGGADITIRNAVGQTPLEEAEQTGCDGSDACVAFLKVHWAKLEDEVNKRMRTMLELEDDSSVATPGKAAKKKKKHKKNNHAAKKKLPPPSTTKMSTAPSSPKADEDESSDDGASVPHVAPPPSTTTAGIIHHQPPSPTPTTTTTTGLSVAVEDDAWTTVCRKQPHDKKDTTKSLTPPVTSFDTESSTVHPTGSATKRVATPPPETIKPSPPQPPEPASSSPPHDQPQQQQQPPAPHLQPTLAPSADVVPTKEPRATTSSPTTSDANSTLAHSPPPLARPFRTSNSPPVHHHREVLSTPRYTTASSIPFLHHRPTHSLSNMPSAPISSLTWQAHIQPVSSSATPSRNGWWSDRHYRKGAAVPLRPANLLGWLQHLDTNVRDALAMLACGTCGDWVHDNLQCPHCQQLYCHRCVPLSSVVFWLYVFFSLVLVDVYDVEWPAATRRRSNTTWWRNSKRRAWVSSKAMAPPPPRPSPWRRWRTTCMPRCRSPDTWR